MTGLESDYLVRCNTHTHRHAHMIAQWSSDTVNEVYVINKVSIRQMAVKWGIL